MSNTSEPTNGLLSWLKSYQAVTFAAIGILIYVIFSVPAAYFYASLGTSPSEVGFNYTNIISGSPLGLAVIVTVTIAALYVYGSNWSLTYILYTSLFIRFIRVPIESYKDLDARQFAKKLKEMKRSYNLTKPSWEEAVQSLMRLRALSRQESLTPDEMAEKKNLEAKSRQIHTHVYIPTSPLKVWKRMSRKNPTRASISLITFLAVIVTAGLAFFAGVQADSVKYGNTFWGSTIGLFDYRAQPVYVKSASADGDTHIPRIAPCYTKVFLLGENAQNVIVYVPSNSSPGGGFTARLPVSDVILSTQSCPRPKKQKQPQQPQQPKPSAGAPTMQPSGN
jgi:hypothetical protein